MAVSTKADRQQSSFSVSPLSGSTANEFLCEVDGYSIWRDPQSATDFVWPMPTEEKLKALYDRAEWFEGGEKGGYESYDRQTELVLPLFHDLLAEYEKSCTGRSLLDVGCGYGSHLEIAAARGWKCFGIEVSEHARKIAQQRSSGKAFVVESVDALIPHQFDLILMLDVLEHLKDPYQLFYKLFSKGAITPSTRIAITTPNARSTEAISNPAGWAYRHPPSHLVYYSAQSLRLLMSRLQFEQISVEGIHPLASQERHTYPGENSPLNDSLAGYAGVLCKASGSNFAEFIHERFLPGTWSKLAEYEHMPRYRFAQQMIQGATVLDFGCGTGYGSALLAQTARKVRAIDIDESALAWAREHHRAHNLQFERRTDLGSGLGGDSFDAIVCFEVLEHLDEATQVELMRTFARLLGANGQLVISTPNPAVTVNYGENPYHLRERSRQEFEDLLRNWYRHVVVLNQVIRPAITIEQDSALPTELRGEEMLSGEREQSSKPVAFVAVCSQAALPPLATTCYLDGSFDYAANTVAQETRFHGAQFRAYENFERLAGMRETVANQERNIAELTAHAHALGQAVAARDGIIAAFQQSKVIRLRDAIRHQPFSFRKIATIVYLLTAMVIPARLRQRLQPLTKKAKEFVGAVPQATRNTGSVRKLRKAPAQTTEVKKVSVVIPTKNAGDEFRRVVGSLRQQQFDGEVELIVIDSGSTDCTADIAAEFGARVIHITAEEFDHGRTRDLGVRMATGDVVVLMTQDAIPGDMHLLAHLAEAFRDPLVAGAYARQVPRPEADVLTERNLNAWETGRTTPDAKWIEDEVTYRAMSPLQQYMFCNFDNVCSAIRKSTYRELPFLASDFGEDIEWGKRALESGWKIAYQPAAHVIHSHARSVAYEYRRNYACHRKLNQLFGLHSVPSWFAAAHCLAKATVEDCRFVLRSQNPVGGKLSLLVRIPFLNAAAIYAQYRGAKSATQMGRSA